MESKVTSKYVFFSFLSDPKKKPIRSVAQKPQYDLIREICDLLKTIYCSQQHGCVRMFVNSILLQMYVQLLFTLRLLYIKLECISGL